MGPDIVVGYFSYDGDHGTEVGGRGKTDKTGLASRVDDNNLAPAVDIRAALCQSVDGLTQG